LRTELSPPSSDWDKMSSFPWESSTQSANRLAVSRRIETGPLAGRYAYSNDEARARDVRAHEPRLRHEPRPPAKLNWAADGGHPKGKREWEQWQERTVPTLLPPDQSNGRPDPIVAVPLSSAHSRLLPAGRAAVVHLRNDDPKRSQRMRATAYRRPDQGKQLLHPDPTAPPPVLLHRFDGRGDVRKYRKDHVTFVEKPRYDPIRHQYQENTAHFEAANRGKRADLPQRFGASPKVTPQFVAQVARRKDERLLPDAARGKSKFGHMRFDGENFLSDPVQFHGSGSFLNQKSYTQMRHMNLGGHALKNIMDHGGKLTKFQQHQRDHMSQEIAGIRPVELAAEGEINHASSDAAHIIPDGQINEFKTEKWLVSDWAVSADAPEWIVAQARRSGVNSVLARDNDFTPDDGQVNEFKVAGAESGVASDWAVSGDAPDWIRNNVAKYDKNAVITRKKKAKGVRSVFYNQRGEEISDSTVSGDAPHFMVEVNERIDPASIIHPPENKKMWHNKTAKAFKGRHSSHQSTETWDDPKGGVKVDFDFDYGATSTDAPHFVAKTEQRSSVLGKKHMTARMKKQGKRSTLPINRASWNNRNVMGGCHGRVALAQKDLTGIW
jgi:hypothetical protein